MIATQTHQLSYTANAGRKVKPVPAWVKQLVPRPSGKNETIKSGSEEVERDTMPLIRKKVYSTRHHTSRLAPKLKGATLAATTRNNWNFVYDHIAYVKDAKGKEQVRSPRRLIWDGKGDCDCFVVCLSSLLINQGIPHFLRIIKQNGSEHWSHIYIIVPKNGNVSKAPTSRSEYIALDCVTDSYDYEPPFTSKKDFTMALEYLDGLANAADACARKMTEFSKLVRYMPAEYIESLGLIITEDFLNEHKITFRAVRDENSNALTFEVSTPRGPLGLPTIINKDVAQKLLACMNTDVIEDAIVIDEPTQSFAGLGWWAVGFAALMLLGRSNVPTTNLSGVQRKTFKPKPKARAYKTLQL